MKLAILTHEPFYPPSGGGSAELIYLVNQLTSHNHDVHLFCPKFPDVNQVEKQFSIQVHPFKIWQMSRYTNFRLIKYLLYPFALRRLVKRTAKNIHFDVILSQHAISSVAAGQLKTDLDIPVAMNFLDHLTGFMETWPRWIIPRFILKRLMQFELNLPCRYNANAVLTVSKELCRRFIETGFDSSRIITINYGYDSELFKLSKIKIKSSPTVVMHGSFDTHHLGEIATKSIYLIAKSRPEVRFLFVGKETKSLKNLSKKIRQKLPEANITCTGFIEYKTISNKLIQGHVGIIPYEESAGSHCAFVAKMVEYAAVGLPVVSTPLSGTKTFFSNEPSICFSKFDGNEFSVDVLKMLDSPPQFNAIEKLAKRVENELNWKTICNKVVNQLEALHP